MTLTFPMFFDGDMADPIVLLVHTIGAGLELAVAIILLRALYLLRRNGESPREFVSIAIILVLASLARIARLSHGWASRAPLFWLDAITNTLLFIVIIYIPVVLSARYFPIVASDETKLSQAKWLQWAMIGNAVCGIVAFVIAVALRSRPLIALIPYGVCTISAVLLWIRVSLFTNLQLRQRGLLLFAGLTTFGLLGIVATLVYGYSSGLPKFLDKRTVTAWVELCNMLIVLGMMFAFASLRLADIIVKRVTGLYVWSAVSLFLWGIVTSFGSFVTDARDQKASIALLSIVIIGVTIVLTPAINRKIDDWIDAWVFQLPDFHEASEQFWNDLSELPNVCGRDATCPPASRCGGRARWCRRPGGLAGIQGKVQRATGRHHLDWGEYY